VRDVGQVLGEGDEAGAGKIPGIKIPTGESFGRLAIEGAFDFAGIGGDEPVKADVGAGERVGVNVAPGAVDST